MVFQLKGERIILKIPQPSDAKAVCKYIGEKAIARYTFIPYPYNLNHAKKWIRKVNKNFRKKTDYEFSIFLKSSGEIIGGMGLLHVDKTNRNAEVGYWLAKKYWGQGLAKEALQMVLSFGFRRLRLRKIYARVMQPNKRSCKLLESVGFKFEGRLKQQMKDRFSKNRWFDEMRFGLLSD